MWQAAQSEFGIIILNRATRHGLRPHRAPDTRAGREGLSRVLGSHGWCGVLVIGSSRMHIRCARSFVTLEHGAGAAPP